jgi:hydroxymethylpyrimidine pyrophosphatase-like HAD family hydrolase
MKLPLEIIMNKGALMVLPKGVDKGSGLRFALHDLQLEHGAFVACAGDAENDHALFGECGFRVAVANATDALKEKADWVTRAPRTTGVLEILQRIVDGSLGDGNPGEDSEPLSSLAR